MYKNVKGKDRRRERIGEILDRASQQRAVSDKTSDMVDRWLLDSEDDPETGQVILDRFETELIFSHKPSAEARKSWRQARRRLGMEDSPAITARKISLYRRTYFRVASAAAVLAIALFATFTLMNREITDIAPTLAKVETYSIEAIAGINKDAYLRDSTHVWINENSKLTVPVTFNGERHVELEGEAYFDVKHDDAQPFYVHTAHLDVRVLGTEFDVKERAGANHTEVVLYKGSVEVRAGNRAERLSPGERLTYDHATRGMTIEKIATEMKANWRTDEILALHKTIPELLRMVGNYYDIGIVFDETVFDGETYVFGFNKHQSVGQVLDVMAGIGGGFSYTFDDNSTTIYIKPTH